VSDWRFKSFKAVTLSAKSPEKALYFGARLPQTHPNHPRLKNTSELIIRLEKGFDDLDGLRDLLLSGRSIASILPALERLVLIPDEADDTDVRYDFGPSCDASSLIGAMDLPPRVVLVLESTDERQRSLHLDGLPSTLQRLAIMQSPTPRLSGTLPAQLKHLEVLLETYQPPLKAFTTDEEIAEAAEEWYNTMVPESHRELLMHARPSIAARLNAISWNSTHAVPVAPKLPLAMVPPSLETLELLFDEADLDLELPALPGPDDHLEPAVVWLENAGELGLGEHEVVPPPNPLQRLARGLDDKYEFTGSLQHATSLRLVRCKVLYSGEVPTHSPLELERLRDHVSSRCKPAATVVFQVSSSKKFV